MFPAASMEGYFEFEAEWMPAGSHWCFRHFMDYTQQQLEQSVTQVDSSFADNGNIGYR